MYPYQNKNNFKVQFKVLTQILTLSAFIQKSGAI